MCASELRRVAAAFLCTTCVGCHSVLDLDRFRESDGGMDAGDDGGAADAAPPCACPDDGDLCTVDFCDGFECIHVAVADGTACGSGGEVCCRGACAVPDTGDACGLGCEVCTGGQACNRGSCGCDTVGFADCNADGVCENLMFDDANCGRCDAACPMSKSCVMGVCMACSLDAECDDGLPCTMDTCTPATGTCARPVMPGTCLIEGSCYLPDDGNTADPCQSCQPSSNQRDWTPTGGASCNDGDTCTTGDTCQPDGTCSGTALACDDGNPCTVDTCTRGTCGNINAPDGTPCMGENCCGGICVDLDMDRANCGGCGLRCEVGADCVNHRCACIGRGQCPGPLGSYDCDTTETPDLRCRCRDATACASGQSCSRRVCVYP